MVSSITDLEVRCSKTVFCSDLHCRAGRPCPQLRIILRIAQLLHADCLVVAGDLFEDLHYKINYYRLLQELRKIGLEGTQPLQIIYTPSRSSHDPKVEDVPTNLGNSTLLLARIARIPLSREQVVVTHGDFIITNGAIAHLFNKTAWIMGRSLFLEEITKKELGIEKEWFIMGHTHIPGIDVKRKIGNTGSWKTKWRNEIPYWRKPSRTLIFYDGKSFKMLKV